MSISLLITYYLMLKLEYLLEQIVATVNQFVNFYIRLSTPNLSLYPAPDYNHAGYVGWILCIIIFMYDFNWSLTTLLMLYTCYNTIHSI